MSGVRRLEFWAVAFHLVVFVHGFLHFHGPGWGTGHEEGLTLAFTLFLLERVMHGKGSWVRRSGTGLMGWAMLGDLDMD